MGACNVSYCPKCWDRALASSLTSGDRSRCPTCRGAVRVDFDPIECRLVFSREVEDQEVDRQRLRQQIEQEFSRDETYPDGRPDLEPMIEQLVQRFSDDRRRQETIERLARQACPAMTRILGRYRESHDAHIKGFLQNPAAALEKLPASDLRQQIDILGGLREQTDAAGCAGDSRHEEADLVQRLIEVAGGPSVASFLISTSLEAPRCVCGGALERMSSNDRTRLWLRKLGYSPYNLDEELQRHVEMGRGTQMVCDICDTEVSFGTFMWSCSCSDTTVLHATTYDICEACFTRHACAVDS